MGIPEALIAHLADGTTTICRCWAITRKDGLILGFTDHDLSLSFEGLEFVPTSGMSARALEQTTGMSVDNSEALGVLSSDAVTEVDIQAGRYDGAGVKAWLVNWTDVSQRVLQFNGTLGELQRSGGAFQAELRGLTEGLNQPQGKVFQKPCSAVLGDKGCQFDLDQAGYSIVAEVVSFEDGKFFEFADMSAFDVRWFERGKLTVQLGTAAGLIGLIKNDHGVETRRIELWEIMRALVSVGDLVRLDAGCDRRAGTCKLKFHNFPNFQGFPTIPGEDWLMSVPRKGGKNDGGSLN